VVEDSLKAKGPEPKVIWLGVSICPAENGGGCTYLQGYWRTHSTWPSGFSPDAPFFLSGLTWQRALETAGEGNGYYILANQYIAAVINHVNGVSTPQGVQDTLDNATAWLLLSGSSCLLCGWFMRNSKNLGRHFG
jgi:hypothetical protein